METVDECEVYQMFYCTSDWLIDDFLGDNEVISMNTESDIVVKCITPLLCFTKKRSATHVRTVRYSLHCVYLASSRSSVGLKLGSTPATHMAV